MIQFGIVLVLVLLNGLFALSELAVVSSRRARLKAMADAGRPGAASALALAADPGRFLSTVQIGITLVGILAGAFSGSTLGARLAEVLMAQGLSARVAEPLGFGLVVAVITYLSLIIGELVPKHLALRNAEGIACAVAPSMAFLSRVAAPVVWLLDASTRIVFRLFGLTTEPESAVTEEEVRTVIAEAESAGVLEADERRMISGVLRLGDRPVRGVMMPRTDVDWLDAGADDETIRGILMRTPHSRLPVAEGSTDAMIGVVQAREILAAMLAGGALDIRAHVRPAPVVHDNADALDVLSILQKADVPMALVHDEYGNFEGIVTPADVLEAIVGVFRSDTDVPEPHAVEREDGSWLLAGYMPADEMAETIGLALPEDRSYQTVAGFLLSYLHHLPQTGEHVETMGWRFEVVDMDGRRIDKVLAERLSARGRRVIGEL